MNEQAQINFDRIAEAIHFIKSNNEKQPSLEEIAVHVNMSAFHFQKMFTEWAGVSPKKFLQYITVSYAKNLLREKKTTLFETTIETGLSSTSRLHDLFVNIEGMTAAEFKNEGISLTIKYNFYETIFGNIIVANTDKGICYIAFYEEKNVAVKLLQNKFSKAVFLEKEHQMQKQIVDLFANKCTENEKIILHVKGTPFQLKVWEALLNIPQGQLTTYGNIANKIENPKASRAVGTAIGDNPIAYIIPCHRVIQSTGVFGQYMWGAKRKTAIIGWEGVRQEGLKDI
jgi:AraC family transcriptional regulator, regulatory protein of adaptative response / methylated-DNA-[protein]-cysteine methyltransferase